MLKEAGIILSKLPDEEFDEPLGIAHRCRGQYLCNWWRYGSCIEDSI